MTPLNFENQINISTCSIEDQVKIVLKEFASWLVTVKKYEILADKVSASYKMSGEAWDLLLDIYQQNNRS